MKFDFLFFAVNPTTGEAHTYGTKFLPPGDVKGSRLKYGRTDGTLEARTTKTVDWSHRHSGQMEQLQNALGEGWQVLDTVEILQMLKRQKPTPAEMLQNARDQSLNMIAQTVRGLGGAIEFKGEFMTDTLFDSFGHALESSQITGVDADGYPVLCEYGGESEPGDWQEIETSTLISICEAIADGQYNPAEQ